MLVKEMATSKEVKPEEVVSTDPDRYYKGEFKAMDFNKDGRLYSDQFLRLIVFLGFDGGRQAAQEILSSVDKEGSGSITIEQYVAVMRDNSHLAAKTTRIRDFFSRFDDRKDGKVPIASVFRGFETMGFDVDEELKEKIQNMDANKDGMISYSEFLHAQLLQKNILRASESQ